MREEFDLSNLKPVAGRIIVQLDKVNGIKKMGSVFIVDETSRDSKLRKATIIGLGLRTWRGAQLGDGKHDFEIGSRVVIEMKAAKLVPMFEKFRVYVLWWTNVVGLLDEESDTTALYGDLQ